MKLIKPFVFFTAGGTGYVLLELLWRGRSHISMFCAGGVCFLLLGKLQTMRPRLSFLPRALMGSLVITSAELLTGLLVNRNYQVWDYRKEAFNFHGQICPQFMLLWLPVSLGAMWLYEQFDRLWIKK